MVMQQIRRLKRNSEVYMKAQAKYVRISPRKARLVADLVRGLRVEKALTILKFTPTKAATLISSVVHSALSNASQQGGIDVDSLRVSKIFVDEGPTWKRFMPRSQGRANRICKRTSHITVVLSEG